MTDQQLETIILTARLVGVGVALSPYPVQQPMLVLPDTAQVRAVVEVLKVGGLS